MSNVPEAPVIWPDRLCLRCGGNLQKGIVEAHWRSSDLLGPMNAPELLWLNSPAIKPKFFSFTWFAPRRESRRVLALRCVRCGMLEIVAKMTPNESKNECAGCGYSRYGLEMDAPCPECGRTAISVSRNQDGNRDGRTHP